MEAIENAAVANVADRVEVLRTLRRYADFLGLPGDQYVLVLVDNWPSPSGPPPQIVPLQPASGSSAGGVPIAVAGTGTYNPLDTGNYPAVPPVHTGPGTGLLEPVPPPPPVAKVVPVPAPAGPAPGRVTGTGPVPVVGPPPSTSSGSGPVQVGGTAPPGTSGTGPVGVVGAPMGGTGGSVLDTGLTAAVGPVRPAPERPRPRRTGTPWALRIVVVLVALAVLLGVAGLFVNLYEPNWLHKIGIGHAKTAGTSGAGKTTTTAATKITSATMSVKNTSPSTATVTVKAKVYLVSVTAVGGPCWMQATATPGPGATPGAPLFAGVVTAGQSKDFFVKVPVTLETGSTAAQAAVLVGKRTLGTFRPTAAPFTVTFRATPS